MLYLKGDLGYAFNRTKSTTLNVILHDYTGNGQDYIEKQISICQRKMALIMVLA